MNHELSYDWVTSCGECRNCIEDLEIGTNTLAIRSASSRSVAYLPNVGSQ